MTHTDTPVLATRGLEKTFSIGGSFSRTQVRALGGVDLDIAHPVHFSGRRLQAIPLIQDSIMAGSSPMA